MFRRSSGPYLGADDERARNMEEGTVFVNCDERP
jgi:hypothetical protein